ncbi:MAG: hypothetical protein U9O96_00400 [Candidatus Thermoplasmatota archaeon]|nr:hypothetical protein [Candidatus Thermoplasmatota archaeon]
MKDKTKYRDFILVAQGDTMAKKDLITGITGQMGLPCQFFAK